MPRSDRGRQLLDDLQRAGVRVPPVAGLLRAHPAVEPNAAPPEARPALELPDLDDTTPEIVVENLHAAAVIYHAWQLEEIGLFVVADRVAVRFVDGVLSIGPGAGGAALYEYWRRRASRLSAAERRGFYARGFDAGALAQEGEGEGTAGDARRGGAANVGFAARWNVFLSSVMEASRGAGAGAGERARGAARELARDLSRHGGGAMHFASAELQAEVKQIRAILGSSDVLAACGAQTVWQLVERVGAEIGLEGGGAGRGARAATGARIIQWLATNRRLLVERDPPPVDFRREEALVADVEAWLLSATG